MKEIKRRFGEVRDFDEKARTAEFIVSTATKDRHGTILDQDNWNLDNYRKNPVVAWAHDIYGGLLNGTNPDNIIGTAEVEPRDGKLIARTQFEPEGENELTDKIVRKIKNGTLRATSVGFLPIQKDGKDGYWGEGEEARDGDNPTFYFYGQELLEISVVPIPSNPDAIKNSAGEDKGKMLRWMLEQITKDTDIEGLTVKGLFSVLDGQDYRKVLEEENRRKINKRELELHKVKHYIFKHR